MHGSMIRNPNPLTQKTERDLPRKEGTNTKPRGKKERRAGNGHAAVQLHRKKKQKAGLEIRE